MATNNPIQLLVTLGVNTTTSLRNIQTAIDTIKSNLDLNLDIKTSQNTDKTLTNLNTRIENLIGNVDKLASAFGKIDINISSNDEKKIQSLTKEIENLKSELIGLKSATANMDASGISKSLDKQVEKVRTSTRQMDEHIKGFLGGNGTYALNFGPKDGDEQELLSVIQTIKNDLGEIEKIKFKPIFEDDQLKGFDEVERTLTDISSKDLGLNTEKLEADLKRMLNQGKLTSEEFKDYMTNIANATDNIDLDNIRKNLNLNNINNTGSQKFEDTVHEIYKKMLQLRDSAVLSTKELNEFSSRMNSLIDGKDIGDIATANTLLAEMKKKLDAVNYAVGTKKMFESQLDELERMENLLVMLEKRHRKTFDPKIADAYRQEIIEARKAILDKAEEKGKTLTRLDLGDSGEKIATLTKKVDKYKVSLTEASRASMGLGESLRIAMTRFPIWMAASTAFYTVARGIQSMTQQVIMLDTAITDLRRVMDIEDYKFNTIVEEAIVNVDALSGKTEDYMKLVGDFGRTGMDDVQSIEMANVGTMMQNISELNADEAFNTLTTAMIVFKDELNSTVEIADKLNEVDNNFAITTKDLSLAMNKAASTAKTFGVSLDELVGYTTAIGSATRESGNVVGNGLKTIMSRITTNKKAIDALNEIGISVNDLEGNVRPVAEIIDEVAGKWDKLSDAQRQNTAIGVAGTYQLTRWNALMLNYDTALQATETSMNSFNSASREQEKYNQSLEARINRLSTAWTSFANSAGNTVIYDTIVVVTEALNKAADGSDTLIGKFGLFGPALGIISAAIILVNGNLRSLIYTKYQDASASVKATGATGVYAAALTGLGTAAKLTTAALRGLFIASGIGLIFVGVGFVLEKVINVMSENIQKQEEFESYLKSNTAALMENRENTMQLVNAYKTLSDERGNSTWDSEKEKEYLQVQQQLGEIFPGLIDHVDLTGQAHLKSAELIDKEIESTEKLVEAQHRLTLSEATESFEDLKKAMDGKWYESFGNFLSGSLLERINNLKNAINLGKENGVNTSKLQMELLQLEKQYQTSSEEIKGSIFKIVDSINYLNNVKIDNTLKSNVENFVAALDTSNLNPQDYVEFAEKVAAIMEKMQKALNTDDATGYSKAVAALNELASTTSNFDPKVNSLSDSLTALTNEITKNGGAFIDAEEDVGEYGDAVEELDKAFKTLTDSISFVNGVLEEYADNNHLSASTMLELVEKYPELLAYVDDEAQLIKELTKIRDKDVETAEKQLAAKLYINEDFYNKNLTALEKYAKEHFKFYEGDLKDWKNLAQAKADVEVELINQLAQKWGIYYSKTSQQFMADNWARGTVYEERANKANEQLQAVRSGFENFALDRVNLDFKSLGTSLDKNTKSTKKNTDATKEAIYYTDRYKQKIDELTLAIERQKNIQSKYPEYHDKYIKAVEKQLALEKEKLKTMNDQAASLAKQIKTGKIQETGIVDTTPAKTTTSNRKLSGWGGAITDTYGTYRSFRNGRMHTGVDIAGKKGTKLESNINGKVIATGNTKLSGNYVQILDSNGMKHFYGHLDRIVATLGQVVKVGTHIGNIGNTGNVYSRNGDGSHLHYQISNPQGKTFNPMSYVQAARKNQTVTTTKGGKSASTLAAESAKSIDDAKAALNSLKIDILTQQELIAELEKTIIDSTLAAFENKRSVFDDHYRYEEAKLKNISKTSERYNATIMKQVDLLAKKRRSDRQELAYIDKLIKKGGLSAKVLADLTARRRELNTSIQESDSTIAELKNSRISNNEIVSEQQSKLIQFMTQKIESLTVGTDRYNEAVIDKIGFMQKQLKADEAQLAVEKQKIISGQYTGEALDNIIEKVETLTLSTMALAKQIKDENYNLIVSIKVKTDELIDDKNFEIERSKLMQSLMVEGSANWIAESEKQVQWLMESLALIDKQRQDMQKELLRTDLGAAEIKQITEDLEDLTLAYWNTKVAIDSTTKSAKKVEEAALEEIYNDLLNAYKDYVNERKEEHLKALDDELEAEEKAHNDRLKMLEDELSAFQKAANEKLRILERSEAERDYNMEIDDLTSQRSKVQEQINRLSLENTNEAKAKRKKLQEELDKIDKDIAEKRHDRDIELQKQAINDSVELKEEEISEKQKIEDDSYDKVVKRIDKEKKYWEKHYEDLLNDERKFAQLREDVMNKNFLKIAAEFGSYVDQMKLTMPGLEDTMDGTMEAVGTSIRKNVIENLEKAFTLMRDFNAGQLPSDFDYIGGGGGSTGGGSTGGGNAQNPSVSDPFDPNKGKDKLVDDAEKDAILTLSEADMKVLLAKYMKEKLIEYVKGQNLGKETKQNRIDEIRRKADLLAAQGRLQGSTIPKDKGLDTLLLSYPKNEVAKLSDYIKANKNVVANETLQKQVIEYAKRIASLDSGGYINTKGTGIDGKGGALSIVHPHEVILDKVDTKALMKNIGVMDNMVNAFKNSFANIKATSLLPSMESGHISVEVTGDNYYNNGQDANKVFNKIVDGIRRKGGRL